MRMFIRYFFRGVRAVLTPFVLLGEKLATPQPIERDPETQAEVDAATRNLALYQFPACPFCVKVRRSLKRLALNIELRNAQSDTEHRTALLEGGGRVQVPCLLIEHPDGSKQWLYESADIINYLESRFAPKTA